MSALRFGSRVKELRIHLCQTSKQSAGVRDFIQQHYVDLKKSNPKFPILIRECSGVQPRVWVRYEKGQESSSSLTDLNSSSVLEAIKKMVSS